MKSRHRVKTYGEVFTPRHMVNRMLDLVREELEIRPDFVDKTFLEPAAGTATSWSRSCTANSARSRSSIRPRRGRRPPCSPSPRSTASSCWRTTTGTPRRRCSPSSWAATRIQGVPCGPDNEPATGRGVPHRHKRRSWRHSDWPGLARRRRSSLPRWNRINGDPGMVQREPFTLASLRDDASRLHRLRQLPGLCRIDTVQEGVTAKAESEDQDVP